MKTKNKAKTSSRQRSDSTSKSPSTRAASARGASSGNNRGGSSQRSQGFSRQDRDDSFSSQGTDAGRGSRRFEVDADSKAYAYRDSNERGARQGGDQDWSGRGRDERAGNRSTGNEFNQREDYRGASRNRDQDESYRSSNRGADYSARDRGSDRHDYDTRHDYGTVSSRGQSGDFRDRDFDRNDERLYSQGSSARQGSNRSRNVGADTGMRGSQLRGDGRSQGGRVSRSGQSDRYRDDNLNGPRSDYSTDFDSGNSPRGYGRAAADYGDRDYQNRSQSGQRYPASGNGSMRRSDSDPNANDDYDRDFGAQRSFGGAGDWDQRGGYSDEGRRYRGSSSSRVNSGGRNFDDRSQNRDAQFRGSRQGNRR